MRKMTPVATALIGVLTGVVCLLIPSAAVWLGSPLADMTRQALELGGMTALVGGAVGARFMPTKSDGAKP